MIGYDRPLKPEWIYKTLKIIEPGNKPEYYYEAYNNICLEKVGKDGRRKTRTVLFRTFLFSFQEKTSIIKNNILIELCKQYDFEFMKPILLSKFILDYEILRFLAKKIDQLFDSSQEISTIPLSAKMIEEYGDLEIIKRSTRGFLKTLSDFKILLPINKTSYKQIPKSTLSDEQVKYILKLYSITNHTKQIDIQNFDYTLFSFYTKPNLQEIAFKYNNQEWEFIKSMNRQLILFK